MYTVKLKVTYELPDNVLVNIEQILSVKDKEELIYKKRMFAKRFGLSIGRIIEDIDSVDAIDLYGLTF